MNKKLLVPLAVITFFLISASALADDKTQSYDPRANESQAKDRAEPIDQQKLKEERAKARRAHDSKKGVETPNAPLDPYGSTPMRTSGGTPLVGDFDEKGQPARKGQTKAHPLPPKGSFGPAGGRVQRDADKQRMQQEREQSKKAWDEKYGTEASSKRPGQ